MKNADFAGNVGSHVRTQAKLQERTGLNMKTTWKLIRRFARILLLSVTALIAINLILFIVLTYNSVSNAGGWTDTEELGRQLTEDGSGELVLSKEGQEILEKRNAWAILIEDGTGNVIWHSDKLPGEIPLHYSAADISRGTQGYIQDYPTTSAARGEDLVIMGHPKTMYWKQMKNTWDYRMIANTPVFFLIFLTVNFCLILLIYIAATSGILRSVKPIINGIEALPEGEEVYIKEKGLFCGLAVSINRVSEQLRMQERALKKKENARADWISGVSHDIRTPLSMVMGYAGQLEEDAALPEEARKKAGIIRLQSIRMKNLVNDLNLASRLEYQMQPMKPEEINLVAVVRQAVVDFMNLDTEGKYDIRWLTQEGLTDCRMKGDKGLILRAVNNILINAQVHNPEGCRICVTVSKEGCPGILIEDNGIGVTQKQLEQLKSKPHYMMSDGSTSEQRHGLGLLIVRRIVEAHHGEIRFDHGSEGGFAVELRFP